MNQLSEHPEAGWNFPKADKVTRNSLLKATALAIMMGAGARYSLVRSGEERSLPCTKWDLCLALLSGVLGQKDGATR